MEPKSTITPERVVAFLMPVFAGISGWIVTLVGKYLPGLPHLDSAELTAMFVTGALAFIGGGIAWLKGRSAQAHQKAMLHVNASLATHLKGMPPMPGTTLPPDGE